MTSEVTSRQAVQPGEVVAVTVTGTAQPARPGDSAFAPAGIRVRYHETEPGIWDEIHVRHADADSVAVRRIAPADHTQRAPATSIQDLRVAVLARIAEACMVQGLPAPADVCVMHHVLRSIDLRMDDGRPEQVDAWAAYLGVQPARDDPISGWVRHRARSDDHDGGLWLGAQIVQVWCAVHPERGAS